MSPPVPSTRWLLGVWDKSFNSLKSFKVKLEPHPKGWAFVPTKKIIGNKLTDNIASADPDLDEYQWVVFEVTGDWLLLANIVKLGYRTYNDAREALLRKTSPLALKWPLEHLAPRTPKADPNETPPPPMPKRIGIW